MQVAIRQRVHLAIFSVLTLALLLSRAAQAAQATLQVDGLTCPFCAFGIEKKLLDLPSVESVEIRMDEGKLTLKLREGEPLDVAALRDAVKAAGFTLRTLLLEDAVGTLSKENTGAIVFRSADPRATFRLRLSEGRGARTPPSGATVLVSGSVEDYDAASPTLVARSLQSLPPPQERP